MPFFFTTTMVVIDVPFAPLFDRIVCQSHFKEFPAPKPLTVIRVVDFAVRLRHTRLAVTMPFPAMLAGCVSNIIIKYNQVLSMHFSAYFQVSVRSLAIAGLASIALTSSAVEAKTFRWASAGDILTMDPHSQNEGLNNPMNAHVYESLVTRGKTMGIEPCLAISWQQIDASGC